MKLLLAPEVAEFLRVSPNSEDRACPGMTADDIRDLLNRPWLPPIMGGQGTLVIAQRTLAELEAVIERGLQSFVAVGRALLEVREHRLYHEAGFKTFEAYCRERWGWDRTYAHRHIQAAKVAEVLLPIGNTPANEAQARELVPILSDESAVVEVFREARERYGDSVTAEKLKSLVDAWKSKSESGRAIHVSASRNEWYTPSDILDRARSVMGGIDLDPASSEKAQQIVKASTWYGIEDGALERAWEGRVWMNPPYSMPAVERFTSKLVDEFSAGRTTEAVVLVNNATDAQWFIRLAQSGTVGFSIGRVRFFDGQGDSGGTPLQGQAFVYLGSHPNEFLSAFDGIAWFPNASRRRRRIAWP